jgi:hypothetical protein
MGFYWMDVTLGVKLLCYIAVCFCTAWSPGLCICHDTHMINVKWQAWYATESFFQISDHSIVDQIYQCNWYEDNISISHIISRNVSNLYSRDMMFESELGKTCYNGFYYCFGAKSRIIPTCQNASLLIRHSHHTCLTFSTICLPMLIQ